jgi:tetratricopeptide (TPR) repeat protein
MRSRAEVVAHLLRHLHDGAALCTNPIATRCLPFGAAHGAGSDDAQADAAACVQAMVSGALEQVFAPTGDEQAAAHIGRQRAIIERCDLQREARARVAADLGISRREFYRERKRACERLAQHFGAIEQREAIQTLPDEFDCGIALADGLCWLGQHAGAIDAIQTLRARAYGASQQIRTEVALAHAYCDIGRIESADHALRRAREIYAVHGPDETQPLLPLEIETAVARTLWLSGKPVDAEAKHRHILAQLHAAPATRTVRAFELEALAWIRLAMLRRDVGDTNTSLAFLRRARSVVRSLHAPRPPIAAELLGNLSLTLMVGPGVLQAATEAMEAYLAFSREHNLLCDVADALASLATVHLQRGDLARSRAFARSGLALAGWLAAKPQKADICVVAALAEAEAGDFRASFGLIARARADAVPGSSSWALTKLAEAQALLSAGAYGQAWRTASEGAELMTALGLLRYAGSALRMAAEAAEGANRPGEAVSTIREALRLLEARGHASSLARAYACSARLTHNTRDADRARDLFEQLREPAGSKVPRLVPARGGFVQSG